MSAGEPEPVDILRRPEAGAKVLRGGLLRGGGYLVGLLVAAVTSVFLLRYLGVEDFGRYAVVAALLGIVSSVTDAGLTAVGARELAVRTPPERERALASLVSLRVGLTAAGVLLAVGFAAVAGFDRDVVLGTLIAGIGVILVNTQATMMLPLSVGLRLGAITAVEVLKQLLTLAGVVVLVAAGAALLAFFGVQVAVGIAVLALTPVLVGGFARMRPSLDGPTARHLIREALPMAAALAMNVVYLRLLVILVSLLTAATATGLFATSFRVFEILLGLPLIVLSVALPLLAVAGAEDRERMRYALQRLTEVALAASVGLALLTAILAEPAIDLLAGDEYAGAAPILQIHSLALVPVFASQAWTLGLVALRRQRAVAWANALALATVLTAGLALISAYGPKGGAAAGVVTETLLAVALLLALVRGAPDVAPSLGFAWKPLVSLGAAAAVLLVPGLSPWVDAAIAGTVYLGAAFAVGAVPREVLPALAGPFGGRS